MSLGAVTEALSDTGMCQVVIATDDLRYHESSVRLHPSVEMIHVPTDVHSRRRTWHALKAELAILLRKRPVYAVHFHGTIPCLIGSHVLGASETDARALYLPPDPDGSIASSFPLRCCEESSGVDVRSSIRRPLRPRSPRPERSAG